jgi:hypothetical protein
VASPNPERDESHDKTDAIRQTPQTQHAQSARDTQSLRSQVSDGNSDHPDCKCHQAAERFAVAKLLLSIVLTVATTGAFAAAAIYACFAHQQIREMRNATVAANESVDALRNSYRPWVGIYGPVALELPLNDPMWRPLTFNLQNSGQSPALNVAVRMDLKLGHGTMQPIDIKLPNGQIAKSVTNVKDASPPILGACKSLPPADYGSISYFPKNIYQTGLSIIRPPISLAERKDVRQGFQSFYLFGCIDYDDDNRCHHQTNVCMKLGSDLRTFEFCSTGNTTKDGPCKH